MELGIDMRTAIYIAIILAFLRRIIHKIVPGVTGRFLCTVTLNDGETFCFATFDTMVRCRAAKDRLKGAIDAEKKTDFVLAYNSLEAGEIIPEKISDGKPHNIWDDDDPDVKSELICYPGTFRIIREVSSMLGQNKWSCG